MLTTKVNNKM